MKSIGIYGVLILFVLVACDGKRGKENKMEASSPEENHKVEVIVLGEDDFGHELVSNGKLVAACAAQLYFQSSEPVAEIWVKNGDFVRKGDPLAQLDIFKLKNEVQQACDEMERTQLELKDVLIGQGYSLQDSLRIPREILKLAKVKSGYDRAEYQLQLAQYKLDCATLTAPFDGVVANLFDKQHSIPKTDEPFCSVIDNTALEADFTVFENELPMINTGDKVKVVPFAMPEYISAGYITEINPWVDENGMVRIKAKVDGKGKLFEGMNIRVSVFRSLGKQLIVPKQAVVMRSGKQVVFTLKNGRAFWNYVVTGMENASQYTITEGLHPGDSVIVSGNINLAHETPVTVIE
ncbi:MAG: efflux RND transporter periplasmic adaptor subunit [Bacteroidales bacterium]|nr:efflux RND transporter periplasmic adaptor subunit [Bacteroidales bacterium]